MATVVTQGGGVDLKAARLSLASRMLTPNWHMGSESAASGGALTPAHASTPSFDLAARREDPGDGTGRERWRQVLVTRRGGARGSRGQTLRKIRWSRISIQIISLASVEGCRLAAAVGAVV